MSVVIGVRGWAVTVGLGAVVAVFLGASIGTWTPAPPQPPPPCRDEVEIRGSTDSRFVCGSIEAHLEAWPTGNGDVLVKCICPRVRVMATPDGGAQ